MTDEAYTLAQTQKERSSLNRGARARKCGSRSKSCRLPSDNLTAAQQRKLNGPVETVNVNQPMTYAELSDLSPSLQFLYLDELVNRHKARRKDLLDMLGCSTSTFHRMLPTLPGKLIFNGRPKSPAPEWLAFIRQSVPAPDPEPIDDPRAIPATTPAPDPEPEKVDTNPPQPIVIQSGSFTIHGTAADLLATLARLIDTAEPLTYTLSFTA